MSGFVMTCAGPSTNPVLTDLLQLNQFVSIGLQALFTNINGVKIQSPAIQKSNLVKQSVECQMRGGVKLRRDVFTNPRRVLESVSREGSSV